MHLKIAPKPRRHVLSPTAWVDCVGLSRNLSNMTKPDQKLPSPDGSLIAEPTPAEVRNGLSYPFSSHPAQGEAIEISPGVKWVRMPLPFSLDHINLYLLDDGDGWVIIDTGLKGKTTRNLWETIFSTQLDGRPVTRVICTHYHPDHIGLAGWLTERWQCPLWMTRTEFLYGRMLTLDKREEASVEQQAFYQAAGYDETAMDHYRAQAKFGFWNVVDPMPVGYHRMQNGDQIKIGDDHWEVVVGRGHAPEHACLWSASKKLMLSGDQVLPRISSNISVYPTEPESNPLEDWIESCRNIAIQVPGNVLVLPAHNGPFHGLHTRLAQLREHHELALTRLAGLLVDPKRAVDCYSVLFRRPIGDNNRGLATGETLAHLNCLLARGLITREMDDKGVNWYLVSNA